MRTEDCHEIFRRFAERQPEPKTELIYHTPFELLIAVMLSAHATDKSVNKATATLFKDANTPQAILKMGEEGVKQHIKAVGLANSKAKNVIKTCRMLIDKHDAKVPDNREDLEALAGVGRKTANVILNIVYKQATMAVDTHIFRVANRTGLAPGKTPLMVERNLLKVVPPEFALNAHHWLILHGRYTCTAIKPKCPRCLIQELCEYPNKTKVL